MTPRSATEASFRWSARSFRIGRVVEQDTQGDAAMTELRKARRTRAFVRRGPENGGGARTNSRARASADIADGRESRWGAGKLARNQSSGIEEARRRVCATGRNEMSKKRADCERASENVVAAPALEIARALLERRGV